MKPRSRRRPGGAEAAPSLQEELVAAIHGAFEVAVEIAVGEVTKLIGRATGDLYEGMRRENESLKQRLQTAEALLDSVTSTEERGGASPPRQRRRGRRSSPDLKVGHEHSRTWVRGDTPPSGPSDQDGRDAQTVDVNGEMSRVCLRVESIEQMCQDLKAQGCDSPPRPSREGAFTSEGVAVKQEKQDEEEGGPTCCLDSIKEEDFSLECMSEAQFKMLEEWKPEELDIQSHDSNTPLSCSRLARAHSPDLTTNLPPPTDHHAPLSSEIFQLAEPAPMTEAPPQVYGVHVRTSRNLVHTFTNLYTCKSCGQTFHLPSLLRRHYGQCQQRLQQYCQQPVAGSRRTRLQIYPPGCSPFRCTECNREFNRMENLKTHLRIHTGERPYTCSVCSKCFRHSGALTRHFRIHTGEKPYICGQCGKSFRNCGGLKFHQRSHSK